MEDLVRVRLDVAYDGTAFAGWAKQADGLRTVQGALEQALVVAVGRAAGPAPRLVVAGRTDAGVHATGQVAHVDVSPAQLAALTRSNARAGDPGRIASRLTALVPGGDVLVRRSSVAPAGFDARFSAVFRRYRYRIADRLDTCDPLQRLRTWQLQHALDDAAMAETAAGLPGLRDFAAFCRPREGATTIRELQAFTWRRDEEGVLVAEVRADAFCHGMVRALVGACVGVGLGRIEGARVGELLSAPARTGEFASAPAHGLSLVEVGYPPDEALADRARSNRALRESTAA